LQQKKEKEGERGECKKRGTRVQRKVLMKGKFWTTDKKGGNLEGGRASSKKSDEKRGGLAEEEGNDG